MPHATKALPALAFASVSPVLSLLALGLLVRPALEKRQPTEIRSLSPGLGIHSANQPNGQLTAH